ncbi:MAG: class I SAM-dependent methyltransferase, partial [Lachnospiraceae bacterium]|nr:class I SAM-dependent methyltransferase [Lachnospiraceae bacterium]
MAEVVLKKGEGRRLKAGGLGVYDNEIAEVRGDFENGDLADVLDFDGYFLGKGFINTRSKITVRLMSRQKGQEIDDEFLTERVRAAWEYRKRTVDTGSCRVIFGEADFLPGLVVDKYADVLVVQSQALGAERIKIKIMDILTRLLAEDGIRIRGIYERSDAKVRLLEGMERAKGFLSEPFDTKVEIVENGVKYQVDVEDGQKTGFFLDQKYNRAAVQKLSRGLRVLDCFTHTGSFALNAARGGAASVLGVDASEQGIEQARVNAQLNGAEESVKFVCA